MFGSPAPDHPGRHPRRLASAEAVMEPLSFFYFKKVRFKNYFNYFTFERKHSVTP